MNIQTIHEPWACPDVMFWASQAAFSMKKNFWSMLGKGKGVGTIRTYFITVKLQSSSSSRKGS